MIGSLTDDAWRIASSAPWSFLIGMAVGFLVSNRWRITRRNGHEEDE